MRRTTGTMITGDGGSEWWLRSDDRLKRDVVD